MSQFTGFRKKNDQFELDALRSSLHYIDHYRPVSNPYSLVVPSSRLNYYSQSSSLYESIYYPPVDWYDEAAEELRSFIRILNGYKHEYREQLKLSKYFSSTQNGSLQFLYTGFGQQLRETQEKLKCTNRIVCALQEFIKTGDVKYLDRYQELYEQLEELTANVVLYLPHHFGTGSTFLSTITEARKIIKHEIRRIVVRILVSRVRDIRQSFRNLVRLLFKNMDDNSGEAHDAKIFKIAHVVSPFNYQNHETSNNRTYRKAA